MKRNLDSIFFANPVNATGNKQEVLETFRAILDDIIKWIDQELN